MFNSHIRQYICKNTKNIQKSDFMDGFCLQGELDLTLFYKIEGYCNYSAPPMGMSNRLTVVLQQELH